MKNFWKILQAPFTVLAPMEDVTDHVFREIMTQLPSPDVFFTEFTSADGLCSKGREETIRRFRFSERQRPIVAQIWGTNSTNMFEAAKLVQALGFDGIDINMGCPVPAVTKYGAGAGHIRNSELAKEIIDAARAGAPHIALSVKTRLGFDAINTEEWIGFLLDQNLAALTVHGRIATQMSRGDADWGEIAKAVQLRNTISPDTIVIGNGDILSYAQAFDAHKKSGVEGIMIGRGVFYNPWVFEKTLTPLPHTKEEYIAVLRAHLSLFNETWAGTKNFQIMKKFFKMYVKGFDGANDLRQQLMECRTSGDVENILNSQQDQTL